MGCQLRGNAIFVTSRSLPSRPLGPSIVLIAVVTAHPVGEIAFLDFRIEHVLVRKGKLFQNPSLPALVNIAAVVTLAQAYADIRDGEAWLNGLEISTYDQGNRANHEPMRARKLLLHRREIDSLYGKIREKGLTIVPTRLYFKDSRVKIELAVARGKEQRDKRRDVVERDAKRQMERALKTRR